MLPVHDEALWDLETYTELMRRSTDARMLLDADGTVVAVNRAVGELLALPEAGFVGRTVVDFGREQMHGLQREAVRAVSVNRVEVSVREARVQRGDGTWADLDLVMVPVVCAEQVLVCVALSDVGDRSQQTRLFRGLLEAAPDAMVVTDDGGRIALVNAEAERLFGYERAELVGQPVEVLVPDRVAGMHAHFRSGYVEEPRRRAMGSGGDLRARRKDGAELPVEVTLSPLETDGGLLVLAAVRDITERRRLQEENDRVKDEFFATVSHELRTPLTSMIGYGELMGDLEDLSPQGRRFLSVIMRSAERELRLVDDLLTLVAMEESGLSIRSAELDLEQVVREAVEAARPRAEEARLSLALHTPGTPVRMRGDRDRMGQALDNLLSNAIKFTPAEGEVRVVLSLEGQRACVDVVDTGAGISEEDRAQLFERLYRAPSAVAQQTPGAGLGLAIALAIVEAHAGTVELVSSGAEGSTFRMRFPLRRGEE